MRRLLVRIGAQQNGQTLVLVALGIVVLVMAVALAVDGGSLYSERRHMQNAADAAALEAARARCFDNSSPDVAAAKGRAFALPARNRAQDATVTYETGGWIFNATAWENAPTYFAGVFGASTVRVEATARAACGAPNAACGLLPLAFDASQWAQLSSQCGKRFYVWTSTNDQGGNNDVPTCTQCNCDYDPLTPGNEFIDTAGRAWLDFTDVSDPLYPDTCAEANGCGASEVGCWFRDDSPGRIKFPSCVSGDTGVKAGVKNDVEYRASLPYPGNIAKIPVYSGACAAGKTGCNGAGYQIDNIGCIKVVGWDNNLELDWNPLVTPGPGKCWRGKVLIAEVSCDASCYDTCGSTTGAPPTAGGLRSIALMP